jgi:hypothetical protein
MVKNYYEYLFEARIEREGEIKFDFTGGGLKKPAISFDALRNPDAKGTVTLELYSKGSTDYTYTPSEEVQAQMRIINDLAGSDEESSKAAMDNVAKLIEKAQDELSADLLQVFSNLEQEIQAVLKKHNVTK